MDVLRIDGVSPQTEADAIVLGIAEGCPLDDVATAFDQAAGGQLSRLVEQGELTGKLYHVVDLWTPPGIAAKRLVLVGLGPAEKQSRAIAHRAAGVAARHVADKPRRRAIFAISNDWSAEWTEAGVAGAIVGCLGQDVYRSERKLHPFAELHWVSPEGEAVSSGQVLGESVNLTRGLVNAPPQEIYPETFAARAASEAAACGIEVEIWDQSRLEEERAGSLLAVARGSSRPARLVILRYQGGAAGERPLGLVGKGVTFDSGGLSLKDPEGMKTMKCDMAGAATVLGAMTAIARLKLPLNAIGLMGLVENMPGPGAMKLGDVLTARNGKTIEVLNTDAEGRLVLADVLDVAVERGAARIIDLATLTGSCVVALGNHVTGLMTNDAAWGKAVESAAEETGEPAWPLPMFPEYAELIKSPVADIKNIGDGRWGGAITAAKFLEEFVDGVPWVHLDIAGPAFLEKPQPWLDAGASGSFVRTLVEVARRYA